MRKTYNTKAKKISRSWVIASLIIFLAIELLLGGVLGQLMADRFTGNIFQLRIEILLMLISYFLGGLVIGIVSPDIRILEPAIGAFLAVFITFLYGFFTPHRFFGFSLSRLLFGGTIAFVLALLGADLGERLAARFGNRQSRKYRDR